MKKIACSVMLACAGGLFCAQAAWAQAADPAWPLSDLRLAGQGMMRFLGFDIYRARLWVRPGFNPEDYAAHPLALELTYQRDFSAQAIAKRSLEEMRRVGTFSEPQAQRWQQALQAALPDVKAGDRLTGIYQPGGAALFHLGGRVVGQVPDPEFARLFFGIWLSPQTSEPSLRQALIAAPRSTGTP
ncbi:MAG: chalcone isomerase family protein [Burkholderiaceae bacterium]|nr:chalcone isomerase family protein [Burkholderiaceae bacterium]